MEAVIDKKKYAEAVDEPIELLDPLPQAALAEDGYKFTCFMLMAPEGNKQFSATFTGIEGPQLFTEVYIRYGDLKPICIPVDPFMLPDGPVSIKLIIMER